MRVPTRTLLVLGIGFCYLAVFGCGPCGLLGRSRREVGTAPAPEPVEISPDLAASLEEKVKEASRIASGEVFQLHITEGELTSYAALRLTEMSLRDPCLRITQGRLHVTAIITQPMRIQVSAICSVRATPSGPEILFEEVTLNGVPMPRFLLNSLSSQANEMIDQVQLDVSITDIRMLAGELVITGTRNR